MTADIAQHQFLQIGFPPRLRIAQRTGIGVDPAAPEHSLDQPADGGQGGQRHRPQQRPFPVPPQARVVLLAAVGQIDQWEPEHGVLHVKSGEPRTAPFQKKIQDQRRTGRAKRLSHQQRPVGPKIFPVQQNAQSKQHYRRTAGHGPARGLNRRDQQPHRMQHHGGGAQAHGHFLPGQLFFIVHEGPSLFVPRRDDQKAFPVLSRKYR